MTDCFAVEGKVSLLGLKPPQASARTTLQLRQARRYVRRAVELAW
jgi:hypothetical protein